jgi:hypothetical protein
MDAALTIETVVETFAEAKVVPSKVASGVIVTLTVVPAVVTLLTVQSTLPPTRLQEPVAGNAMLEPLKL